MAKRVSYEEAIADLEGVDKRLQELSTLRQQIDAEMNDLVGKRNYLAGVTDALAPVSEEITEVEE